MKKTEREFLEVLERKAQEQRRLVGSEILPEWASRLGIWLGVNPWRVIVPLSFFIALSLYGVWGERFLEFSLFLFGYY